MAQSTTLPVTDPNYDPSRPTPILKLSPELRNNIFKLLCQETTLTWGRRSGPSQKVKMSQDPTLWKAFRSSFPHLEDRKPDMMYLVNNEWKTDGKPTGPGFVFACKQIYGETIKVLFFTARFEFNGTYQLRTWLQRVNYPQSREVKQVFLRGRQLSDGELSAERRGTVPNEYPGEGMWQVGHLRLYSGKWEPLFLSPKEVKHLEFKTWQQDAETA